MMVSFCAILFPRDDLDEILDLIESVSEGFPTYSFKSCNYDRIKTPKRHAHSKQTEITCKVKIRIMCEELVADKSFFYGNFKSKKGCNPVIKIQFNILIKSTSSNQKKTVYAKTLSAIATKDSILIYTNVTDINKLK